MLKPIILDIMDEKELGKDFRSIELFKNQF
jgi:hypothetical protein